MFFRTPQATYEARGWDGSLPEGRELVAWVTSGGGQAHLDTRSDRSVLLVWHGGNQQTMRPGDDLLVRTQDGRFQVLPDQDLDHLRGQPVTYEARAWNGSQAAARELITWIRDNGGQAHLDTTGSRSAILVWQGTWQQRMLPDLDLLLFDTDARMFLIRDRSAVEGELVEVPALDA